MTAPLVIGYDTSGPYCTATLLSGDRVVATRDEPMSRGQGERLIPMIEEILADARVDVGDLTAIGVGTGPGNFTGIRVAVAAARGLAVSLGVPAIGVTAFEALLEGYSGDALTSVDARRDMVYLSGPGGLLPSPILPDDLPADLRGTGLAVIGHAAAALAAQTGGSPCDAVFPVAEAIARVAGSRLGHPQPRPAPLYLRPADAAPPADPPPLILP